MNARGSGAVRLAAVVIAQDAARDIRRCVESLAFADEVLVVDGGSADDTVAVARACGARVIQNSWPGFAAQRRFALAQTAAAWVFACDTDEVVTPGLASAIRAVVDAPPAETSAAGWSVRRRSQFLGGWIDVGPWADDRQLRLFRRDAVQVTAAAVHEGYVVAGPTAALEPPLLHYTHPTLSETIRRMNAYTSLEAVDRVPRRPVGALDPLLLPAGVFFNYYVRKGCWRAGMRGYLLAATTAMYRCVLYLKIRLLQREVRDARR